MSGIDGQVSVPAASDPRGKNWVAWMGRIAAILLGLVLIYSAWGKALDPRGTAEIYLRKGLFPASISFWMIVAAVGLEFGLGVALLAGLRRVPVLLAACLLMIGFFSLTGYEFFFPTKETSSCGCFGNLVVRSPAQAFGQDGFFVLLAFLSWLGRPRGAQRIVPWILAVLTGIAGCVFAFIAPSLPVDDLATLLKPGVRAVDLQSVVVKVPELQRGNQLLLILDRADQTTRDEMARVNRYLVNQASNTGVWGIAEDNPTLEGEFQWIAAPGFRIENLLFSEIKPLYRKLPRVALFSNGRVAKIWNKIPDDQELQALAEGRIQ